MKPEITIRYSSILFAVRFHCWIADDSGHLQGGPGKLTDQCKILRNLPDVMQY